MNKNKLYLFLLFIISGYTWRSMLNQVIRSDGYMYFLSDKVHEFFSRHFFYTGFELSAMSLGWLFPKIFGMNIGLYWWASYIVMLVTNGLFFWLAKTIFKKSSLALVASLFFAVNYFGNWDLYSTHCYCFILERIYPVLFLLPSLIFLHRFLEERNQKDFIWSLTLYFIGLGIGHWSLFITAFFLVYPFSWSVFQNNKKEVVKDSIRGLIYLGITGFFVLIQRVNESQFKLKWSFVDFILHPSVSLWPEKVMRQFVYWTDYPVLLQGDIHSRLISRISNPNFTSAVTPYIILTYIIAFLILYFVMPKRRALLITALVGTGMVFLVNAFFGQYDVLYQPGANRYLYYPTMFLALFWTIFIEMLLTRKATILKIIAIIIVSGYVFINATLIEQSYADYNGYNLWTKRVHDYIRTVAPSEKPGTLIVAPYDEVGFYESAFFTQMLSQKKVRVMSVYAYPGTESWEHAASSAAQIIMLEKDNTCQCIKEIKVK